VLPKLLLSLLCGALVFAADPSRSPILVELFTSEGCSSCPPADRLLEQLDPYAIVLSEHVDYWNHLGWKDRFSSHAYTQRQQDYVQRLKLDGPYTPQMVVDGITEFNGSDSGRARQALTEAAGHPKAAVHLSRSSAGLQVDVSDAPRSAAVYLVIADNSAASQVGAGENNGKNLHHVAIARTLRKIGSVKKGGSFSQVVEVPSQSQRAVVFVQESDLGSVDGAAVWTGN
jgi:hypothetical protein